MLVEKFVRGNGFAFVVTPTDVDGAVSEPDSVTLRIRYIDANGEEAFDEIEMDPDTDGAWTGFWDSSVSKKCQIHWDVRAVNPAAADDGVFNLTANLANPDPEATT